VYAVGMCASARQMTALGDQIFLADGAPGIEAFQDLARAGGITRLRGERAATVLLTEAAAKAKAKNPTSTGTTPAFAPSACATTRRWRRPLSISSSDCCARRMGPRFLRVKGIVALGDDPSRPLVIHGVQHVFHPPVRLAAGLTPITAPGWFLFCATWNRPSSKPCG
jgi:hypothetical protein